MPNILVIDDNLDTLQLIGEMLKAVGYRVQPLSDGNHAAQQAKSSAPDLILLDINMPGMNGFQVCESLKKEPSLKDIPVIFLSALSDTADIVRGFRAGGVDYITKPFQIEEVENRVRLHIELQRQKQELESNCTRLKELEQLRDNLFHMIVHDLRSPLGVILGCLELMREIVPHPEPMLARAMGAARACSQRLSEMTNQLIDIHRLEEKQMPLLQTAGDLVQTARAAIDASGFFEGPALRLLAPESVPAVYDEQIIRRVLENLLRNACKFSPDSSEVRVSVSRNGVSARVIVTDSGPGVPAEYHGRIFEKFAQVDQESRRHGAGLGLAFCKLAVEAHAGKIGLESTPGEGSSFWFSLPLNHCKP